MTRRTIACVLLLSCIWASLVRADDPRLRVFYTGHSFHMFVPGRIGAAAKAGDVKEYQLAGTQSIGGSRVIQHWDKDKGDNLARKVLEKGDVDVFTMAAHLKLPDEGIDRFVELGLFAKNVGDPKEFAECQRCNRSGFNGGKRVRGHVGQRLH